MVSAPDIMESSARKDLNLQFPDYDEWEWKNLPDLNSTNLMNRVSRFYPDCQEEAIVAAIFDPNPSTGSIASLSSLPTNIQSPIVRYLLVPKDADLSGIPTDIGILTMKSLGFSSGKLIWRAKKENAFRYPSKDSVCA